MSSASLRKPANEAVASMINSRSNAYAAERDLSSASEVPPLLAAWRATLPASRSQRLRHREAIYEDFTEIERVFIVEEGYVKLTRLTLSGDNVVHALLGPGNLFGRVIAPGVKSVQETATANGRTRVLSCTWRDFEQALAFSASLAVQAISNLGCRIQEMQKRHEYVLHHDLRCRVAAILYDLIGDHGGACRHGHALDIRLTQQELAELVGASRPAVSAVLNELRREGVISYTRAYLCVDSLQHLGNIARSLIHMSR